MREPRPQLRNTTDRRVPARGNAGPWVPPPSGRFKIVTAHKLEESGLSAMSAVCRDEQGKYMGSSSLVLEGIRDRHSLDVIACREGMALAEDLLVQDVIISCEN